jgi:outer membrane protein assembly factor BamB
MLDLSSRLQRPVELTHCHVAAGLLVVQDADDVVHVVDLATGVHRFVVNMPGQLTRTPGVTQRSVTLVAEDTLVSVDVVRGTRLISRPELALDFASVSNGFEANGSIYLASGAPFGVQSVDPVSGLSGWRYRTRGMVNHIQIAGLAELSEVIATTHDGLIVSLPAWPATGKHPASESWTRRLRGCRIESQATLQDGNLLVPASDGFLYCLDARSGVVRWKVSTGEPAEAEPLVADGVVYASADGMLHAIEIETGQVLWEAEQSGRPITRIADYLYLDDDGELTTVMASTGDVLSTSAGSPLMPLIQGGGTLILGDLDGNLVAYQ